MSAAPGLDPTRLCQIEVPVSDIPRALAFYEVVFGWRAAPAELHEYVVLDVPKHCAYGIALVPRRGTTAPGGVTLYFGSEDPEDLCRKAVAHGGTRRFGPTSLHGYGSIYQIEDPEGVRWGLFQRGGVPGS